MPRQAFIIAALFALLVLSGCIQMGGKNFSDLKNVLEKYGLDGVLAPGTMQELKGFEDDLLSLKALAKVQNSREAQALVALIELRLVIVETQRNILNSSQEARFIDYYDPSCSRPTSLKKTIDYLDSALSQADLATARASDFSNNFKEFANASGFDFSQANKTLSDLKKDLLEKKNRYAQFCI